MGNAYARREDFDDSPLLLAHAILHSAERRRSQRQQYYVCGRCAINYLFRRPKAYLCICCGQPLARVQEVDEFECSRIRSWAGENLLIEPACKVSRKESC